MYALIDLSTGAVIQHPYSITNLVRSRKDVCWPSAGVSDAVAAEFGCVKLAPTAAPPFNPATEALDRATPALVDGVWTQQWAVRALTQEQQDAIYAASVPQAVTARQAVQAMILAGIDEADVDAAIAAIEDPVQRKVASNYWNRSNEFERSNPVLASMSAALGLTSAQVDALFIAAAAL